VPSGLIYSFIFMLCVVFKFLNGGLYPIIGGVWYVFDEVCFTEDSGGLPPVSSMFGA